MALSDYIPGALAGAGGFLTGYLGGQQQEFENKLNRRRVDVLDRYRNYLEDVGRAKTKREGVEADIKLKEFAHKQALWDAGNKLLRASNALEQLRLGLGTNTALEHLRDVVGDPGLTFRNGSIVTSAGKAYSLDDARKMLEREMQTYQALAGTKSKEGSSPGVQMKKARLNALVNAYKAAVANGDDARVAYFASLLQQEFGGAPQGLGQTTPQGTGEKPEEEKPGAFRRAWEWLKTDVKKPLQEYPQPGTALPAEYRYNAMESLRDLAENGPTARVPVAAPPQQPQRQPSPLSLMGGGEYPDSDVPPRDVAGDLQAIKSGLGRLIDRARQFVPPSTAFASSPFGAETPVRVVATPHNVTAQSEQSSPIAPPQLITPTSTQGRASTAVTPPSVGMPTRDISGGTTGLSRLKSNIYGFFKHLKDQGAPDIGEAVKTMPESIKNDPVMRDRFLANYKRILKDMVKKTGGAYRQNEQVARMLKAKAFQQALVETMKEKVRLKKK